MGRTVRSAEMTSPGGAYFAAASCLAVSGIMSMTFFRDDWGDRGTVMIGLMALGAIGAVLLFLRGRRLARVRSLFETIEVETPGPGTAAGAGLPARIRLVPARALKVDRVVLRVEARERTAPEGEPMNAATHTVFVAEHALPVGRVLEAGRAHEFEAEVEIPADAPATFSALYHQLVSDLTLDVEGEGFSPVLSSWPLPLTPRAPAPAAADGVEAMEFTSRNEFEGLSISLAGVDQLRLGGELAGEVVLAADEALPHRGLAARLGWRVEGEGSEAFEVGAVDLAPPGELPAGETRLPLRIAIPGDAPASYRGELFTVRWGVEVVSDGLIDPGQAAPLVVRVAPAP